MTLEDYERERQRLEDQLRADIELLQTAHQARLKALEAVWTSSRPASAEVPQPPPVEAPTAPRQPEHIGDRDLDTAVEAALERLPAEFTSRELRRELGFSANRSSLHRVLRHLEQKGALAVRRHGIGRRPTLYKKTGRSHDARD